MLATELPLSSENNRLRGIVYRMLNRDNYILSHFRYLLENSFEGQVFEKGELNSSRKCIQKHKYTLEQEEGLRNLRRVFQEFKQQKSNLKLSEFLRLYDNLLKSEKESDLKYRALHRRVYNMIRRSEYSIVNLKKINKLFPLEKVFTDDELKINKTEYVVKKSKKDDLKEEQVCLLKKLEQSFLRYIKF